MKSVKASNVSPDILKRLRKPRQGIQRKWTTDEVNRVLDYLKETIQKNGHIEKPTAAVYYGKALDKLKIPDVNPEKLRAKVAHLKSTYIKAVEWRNNTGQGVEADEDIKSALIRICPQFENLDEIYGTKANVNPPFVHDSGTKDVEPHLILVDDGTSENKETDVPSTDENPCKKEMDLIKSKLKLNTGAGKTHTTVPKKDALTALSESQSQRCEIMARKLDVEQKRMENELIFKKEELELSKENTKAMNDHRKQELLLMEKRIETDKELKVMEMQKDERLAMLKIEQEFKLQIELAKMKHTNQN